MMIITYTAYIAYFLNPNAKYDTEGYIVVFTNDCRKLFS